MPCPKSNSGGGRCFSLLCGRSVLYFPTYNLTKALAWSTMVKHLLIQELSAQSPHLFRVHPPACH